MDPAPPVRPWRWLLWAFLLVAWTVALIAPVPEPPEGPIGEFITGRKFIIAKTVHVSVYAFFAVLTGWLYAPVRYRWLLVWLLMAHAGATEMIQLHFSYREGSLRDVVLNHVGILLGLLASWKWWTDPR